MSEKELTVEEKIEFKKKQEELAKKEEERLDKLIDEYFMNGLKEPTEEDAVGLNMGMTYSVPLEDEPEEEVEESSPEEDSVVTGVVQEEEDEEEVFFLHDNGQITSEIKESEDDELMVGYAMPRQTIIEKAILNKAVREVYATIKEYEELIALINDDEVGISLRHVLEDTNKSIKSDVRSFRAQLNSTGFSEYIDIPKYEIDLDEIESEKLKRLVEEQVEKITMNTINGGI